MSLAAPTRLYDVEEFFREIPDGVNAFLALLNSTAMGL
jgi:hypothetical protein